MKKKVFLLSVFLLLFFVLIILTTGFQMKTRTDNLKFSVLLDEEASSLVSVYSDGDFHYAFIPSCADMASVKIECPKATQIYLDGQRYTDEISLSPDKEYHLELKSFFGLIGNETTLKVIKAEKVPSLFISLNKGTLEDIHSSKETKINGELRLITSDARTVYSGEIKALSGRGNSSWTKAKKPYNIDFENPVCLIDGVLSDEYCLLANAYDESHIRNKLAFDFAADLGLAGSPQTEFVDLYIDGEYRGLFLLSEKISASAVGINPLYEQTAQLNQFDLKTYSEFRIESPLLKTGYNIPENPANITGGYIVEVDPRYPDSDNVFATESQFYFSVCYPTECSGAQMDYISSLFLDIEKGFADKAYTDFIDIESWAKYYLVQEFFANIDTASFFFYKDSDNVDSKVYAGPVWDFELTCGLGGYTYVDGKTIPNRFFVNNWGLYGKLFESELFRNELSRIYSQQFRPLALTLNERISRYMDYIEESDSMNSLRWRKVHRCDWFEFSDTLAENINYVERFLGERMICFDNVFLDGKPIIKISKKSSDPMPVDTYFYIASAGTIDTLGEISSPGYTFLGWYDEYGNKFENTKPVTQDMTFYARWREGDPQSASEDMQAAVPIINYTHYIGYAAIVIIALGVALFFAKDVLVEIKRAIRRRKNGK